MFKIHSRRIINTKAPANPRRGAKATALSVLWTFSQPISLLVASPAPTNAATSEWLTLMGKPILVALTVQMIAAKTAAITMLYNIR